MHSDNIECLILSALFYNETYTRKVLPFLKFEYFEERYQQELFRRVEDFILSYNNLPTKEAITIQINDAENLSESVVQSIREFLSGLVWDEKTDENWLVDHTEKWCKKRAFVLALTQCVGFVDGTEKKLDLGAAPKIMQDAISISFDPSIGHDFIEDSDERFEFYHRKEEKLEFDLDYFNRITGGGVTRKSLNAVMAKSGGGKTIALCHFAASNLTQGKNVLYITLEMASKRIAQRIDANLLDIEIQKLEKIDRSTFNDKIEKLKKTGVGKLIIEEYPTAAANTNHFRRLVNDLRLKKNFIPDVMYIDYLGIMNSARMRMGGSINSYNFYKAVAEEVRGLAVELNIPIWSGIQLNREGIKRGDMEQEHTSESMGFLHTFDLFVGLQSTEEFEKLNQIVVKQLKNRYNDVSNPRKFLIGIDKSKMRLYDVDEDAQKALTQKAEEDEEDTGPAFDKGKCGERIAAEDRGFGKRKNFSKFSGFKFGN